MPKKLTEHIKIIIKIKRAHKNYLTPEILRGNTLKGDILWHFDFQHGRVTEKW